MKPEILVIIGPTASGKSALAVRLAKKLNGEIISADSRQVYKYLNIGTGKVTKRQMRGVPHHLLSVANPKRQFSVANYQKLAIAKIRDILKRGKLPIVVGGTGFYIQAIVDGIVLPEVKPDLKLRKNLRNKTPKQLFKMLQKADPKRAKTIDKNNPRRLVRAIEIAKSLGRVPHLGVQHLSYDTIQIGIKLPSDKLKRRIKTRLLKRLKQGLITEVKNLHEKRGLSWNRLNELGLEYRYVAQYLRGKLTKKEMLEKLNIEIWHYARRQMTWFKRDKRIIWI